MITRLGASGTHFGALFYSYWLLPLLTRQPQWPISSAKVAQQQPAWRMWFCSPSSSSVNCKQSSKKEVNKQSTPTSMDSAPHIVIHNHPYSCSRSQQVRLAATYLGMVIICVTMWGAESILVGVLCLFTSFLLLCLQLTLEEEGEQNHVLQAGCCCAMLALLMGNCGCLVSKSSSQ